MRAWKLTMDTSSIGGLFILLFKSRRTLCHITKYDASFVLQTFREHQKWLRCHERNLITLSRLKIIQCCLSVLCDYEWVINMWNFMQKFWAVAEKMAKNFRVYFFAAHCRHSQCDKWIIMDTGTGGSQKRKAYTIKVKLTAISHTMYIEKVSYPGLASWQCFNRSRVSIQYKPGL